MTIIGGGAPAPSAKADDLVKDSNERGFQKDVLEASMTQPVIVDFWAPWCGPCRTLGPALEAAVRAAKGAVKMVKINIDENQNIARQLRIQSIPTVYAFDKGQPVDGFMGAIPPSEISRFIERLARGGPDEHGMHEVAGLVERAQAALEEGDVGGAAQDFAHALQHDPENIAAIAGLARCYLMNGAPDQAAEIVAMAPEAKASDPAIASVKAALALASQAKDAGETLALSEDVARHPSDHEKRLALAQALAARGDFAGAVDHLLTIVKASRDWKDGAARQELIKVFEAAGPGSDVAREGRKRLSAILFA